MPCFIGNTLWLCAFRYSQMREIAAKKVAITMRYDSNPVLACGRRLRINQRPKGQVV